MAGYRSRIDQGGCVDTDRLKKIELFSSLPEEELERLAGVVGEVSIDEGEKLLKAGTPPDQLFAIEEGTVEVKRDGETVATVGPGEVVGERGTVKRALRNASAAATGSVRAIFLTADQLRELRRNNPELDERLGAIIEERDE
jgi:CRP/FNR family cyclic AMP-dependent transcriptional regulator